jgi:mRNA-degrading endonuclease RelE of RelBE toxin-antitoxin system
VTRRVETAPTFERDHKRLGRRYRNIRRDVEPLIEELITGELPSDRVMGADAVVYKVRLPNSDARRGKRGGYRVIYYLPLPAAARSGAGKPGGREAAKLKTLQEDFDHAFHIVFHADTQAAGACTDRSSP